jgi:hypothetical protein
MMRVLAWVGRVYAVVAAFTGGLLVAVAAVLFATGALTAERLRAAAEALRAPAPAAAPPAAPPAAAPSGDLEALEAFVSARLLQLEREREELERRRRELREAEGRARREAEGRAVAAAEAELTANVPIFSRLEGADLAALLRGWDDATIVRYLRALRPSKAAEVLEALRTGPEFEEEFRRAAPGRKPRLEAILEEFRKPPGTAR